MRDGNFFSRFAGGLEYFVGLDERCRERLLGKNVSSGCDHRQRHFPPLVGPARSDPHRLRPLFLQHLAIIFILPRSLAPLRRPGPTLGNGIGDGQQLDIVAAGENLVDSVTIVAAAAVADDGAGEFFIRIGSSGANGGGQRGQNKFPAIERL